MIQRGDATAVGKECVERYGCIGGLLVVKWGAIHDLLKDANLEQVSQFLLSKLNDGPALNGGEVQLFAAIGNFIWDVGLKLAPIVTTHLLSLGMFKRPWRVPTCESLCKTASLTFLVNQPLQRFTAITQWLASTGGRPTV